MQDFLAHFKKSLYICNAKLILWRDWKVAQIQGFFMPTKYTAVFSTQVQKLKEDEDLSSVVGLSPTTGADGKTYEMVCLPYEFIFGWLFTINPKNVKEEAREAVSKYRIECYKALFYYFSSQSDFLEEKQAIIDEKIIAYDQLRDSFKQAEKNLRQAKIDLYKAKDFTYEEWVESKRQQEIPFDKEGGDQ